jgi:TRAP-type C4-dicarboxylate transport system permease small subunit
MNPAPKEAGTVMRVVQKIDRGLAILEKQLLAWAIILMAVNTLGNVVARLGFNSSLFFSEELNQFLIVLVTFVGTSAAARQGRHIRMSALTDLLPDKQRRLMFAFIQVSTAVVIGALAWYAVSYIFRVQSSGRVTPALQIPVWTTLLWLPLGLAIAALEFLMAAIANLRSTTGVFLSPTVLDTDKVDMPTL